MWTTQEKAALVDYILVMVELEERGATELLNTEQVHLRPSFQTAIARRMPEILLTDRLMNGLVRFFSSKFSVQNGYNHTGYDGRIFSRKGGVFFRR